MNSSADNGDAHDKNPGDGLCQSWLDECTLRAAIEEANATGWTDAITFASAMTIVLYSDLQVLSPTVTIDASAVWDAFNNRPGVTLDGNGMNAYGLQLSADYCAVYGLYITGFGHNGIAITSAFNTIGSADSGHRNVISGNGASGMAGACGVRLSGSGAHHNTVAGNWIGPDLSGAAAKPNYIGIQLADGANSNLIGGSTVAQGNVISGNTQQGVYISGAGSNGNYLGGNTIGLAANGLVALPNTGSGILIDGTIGAIDNTVIGGAGSGLAGNVIAANGGHGIWVAMAPNTNIGDNTINNNGMHGVYVDFSSSNQIYQNEIAHNTQAGVRVAGVNATGNRIDSNSIHHNGGKGIELVLGNGNLAAPIITGASSNQVTGTGCANCTIQVFEDSADEGQTYRGNATADGAGAWTLTAPNPLTGPNITATNIDGNDNTSEFSTPYRFASPQVFMPAVYK